MGSFSPNLFSVATPICIENKNILSASHNPSSKNLTFPNYTVFRCRKFNGCRFLVFSCINEGGDSVTAVIDSENPKHNMVKTSPDLTEEQKLAISQLPSKMTNRCKVLMKQIICYSTENGSVSLMLASWVKSTKPRRADWLSVLKELEQSNHPLSFEVGCFISPVPVLFV